MLGLGPIGTLKGVQKGENKKPAKKGSSLDFDLGLSDDDDDDEVRSDERPVLRPEPGQHRELVEAKNAVLAKLFCPAAADSDC